MQQVSNATSIGGGDKAVEGGPRYTHSGRRPPDQHN